MILTKQERRCIVKAILKKPLWFTAITTLCFVVVTLFAVSACNNSENPLKHFTLTFVGEGVSIEPQSVMCGNYAKSPENPKREGYGFDGWFTDNGTFANKWDFKTNIVTQDTTLYAKWEAKSLQGTKWKLAGIVDVQTGEMKELEPKDCVKCYTLTFDTDNPFVGSATNEGIKSWGENYFVTFSASNELGGNYMADYESHSFQIIRFGGTKAGEMADGYLYVNDTFWERGIKSFSLQENELRLYFNENKNYLLFQPLK